MELESEVKTSLLHKNTLAIFPPYERISNIFAVFLEEIVLIEISDFT